MSSWANKNVRKKIIQPPINLIVNNNDQDVSKLKISEPPNINQSPSNYVKNTSILNGKIPLPLSKQLKNFRDENNDIPYVDFNLTIDYLLKNKNIAIYIYDEDNTSFAQNLKNTYENYYVSIKIIKSFMELPPIQLKTDINILFLTTPSTSLLELLEKRKESSKSQYYICLFDKKEINYESFFDIFDLSIFSSNDLFKFYSSNYTILNYQIVLNPFENYKNSTFNNIFCKKILNALNTFYENNKQMYKDLSDLIQVYAIYFPQFHEIEENNYTFYKGYNDMLNLEKAKKENNNLHTPLSGFLSFYNLEKDTFIIENQVLMAKSFGIQGFAMYYYWFSENSITGNNMLMSKAIDNFFKDDFNDFKIFFIWANESWSNNVHFNVNSNKHTISNIYNIENIDKNISNLMRYFKHNNYRKINNKPVLFLHNPEQLKDSELFLFYSRLESVCISNNFDGVEFIIYNRSSDIVGFKTYSVAPNPKSGFEPQEINNIKYCDYTEMVTNYIKDVKDETNISGVLINYDNTARLFTHNHAHKNITKYYNCDISSFNYLLTYSINKYQQKSKESEVEKIFLVNAWNEWGEKMTLEPSNELKFNYLTTLQITLSNFFNNLKKKFK